MVPVIAEGGFILANKIQVQRTGQEQHKFRRAVGSEIPGIHIGMSVGEQTRWGRPHSGAQTSRNGSRFPQKAGSFQEEPSSLCIRNSPEEGRTETQGGTGNRAAHPRQELRARRGGRGRGFPECFQTILCLVELAGLNKYEFMAASPCPLPSSFIQSQGRAMRHRRQGKPGTSLSSAQAGTGARDLGLGELSLIQRALTLSFCGK